MNLQFKTFNKTIWKNYFPFIICGITERVTAYFWRALYGKITIMSDMQSGRGKRFYG